MWTRNDKNKLGRTPACVKTRCLRHDAKKGAQLKRMRLWKPPHTDLSHDAAETCSKTRHVPFCASRLRHQYSRNSTSVRYRHDVKSSTREDVIRRRHVLLRCADSSLNHEWSKTASFVSCLDACLDADGVRLRKGVETTKHPEQNDNFFCRDNKVYIFITKNSDTVTNFFWHTVPFV
jgi:hypothetical protein